MSAIVYHPGRLRPRGLARLRDLTGATLALPTRPDEPGGGQTRVALAAGAQRIWAAGGDGTAQAVLSAAAGVGAKVGLIPVGTGNVLARNLGIPRGLRAARATRTRPLDLVEYDADGRPGYVAALAGVGADAAVLADARDRLKPILGPGAYALAGLRHLRPRPMGVRLLLDGQELEREASLVAVGNVGRLWGLRLLPGADPADGLLDVLVASPQTHGEVVAMGWATLLARHRAGLERFRAREAAVEVRGGALAQADGEPLGRVRRLGFRVIPAAVHLLAGR